MLSDLISSFLSSSVLAGQVRHLLSGVALYLVGAGALQSDQSADFVKIGSGVALYLIAAGWSWYKNNGQSALSAELIKLKAQKAPTTAKDVIDAMAQHKP
jgi:hypothetical protein